MTRFWIMPSLCLALAAGACESEHNVHDAAVDVPVDAPTDASTGDAAEDAAEPAQASCGGGGGVTVEGTVLFEGDVPAESRLWIYWQLPSPTIPPCSVEVDPAAFPAPFIFLDVPDSGWRMEALLDMDGGFPPVPVEGDYTAGIEAAELDLAADMIGLELHLEPYAP